MKSSIIVALLISSVLTTHALVITEIFSNPVGDDGGREWIEIYNNTDNVVDLTALTVSIKGGTFIPVTPVSGGTSLLPHEYAVIASTVGGVTRFMQDYSIFAKPLLKSGISLVNTGVTSVELKLGGMTVDTIPSYTAAKEGNTYALINSQFSLGIPTPGEENQAAASVSDEATTSPTSSQATIPRMSSPLADIVLYLPLEKTVVAGAPSVFAVSSLTHTGKNIDGMTYTWSFGDGGERTGSSTVYRYLYPGRYVAQVEGTNGFIAGTGRMNVRVVPPDVTMSTIGFGKYGSYIELTNDHIYDLDISGWKLSIDGALFSFPKNTILLNGMTRFTGVAMGFASTTVSSSTLLKLLFPSMDEVLRIEQGKHFGGSLFGNSEMEVKVVQSPLLPSVASLRPKTVTATMLVKNTSQTKRSAPVPQPSIKNVQPSSTTKIVQLQNKKDTRIATFMRSVFGR